MPQPKPQLEHIQDNTYYLPGSAALLTFTSTPSVTSKPGNVGKVMKIAYRDDQPEIWALGANNMLPQEREALVLDNNIVGELMQTKRDVTVGGGLMPYVERFVDGKRVIEEVAVPEAAQAFFDEVDIEAYLLKACRNQIFHANTFTEFVRNLGGGIASMKAMELRHLRPQKQNARGFIPSWFWSGNWKDYRKKDFEPVRIPNYAGEAAMQDKFIMHCMDDLLSDEYLGIPSWWGGRAWIECANAIPIFHIRNLRNGYTIRWHIEIPKDYFWDYTAEKQSLGKDGRDGLVKKASAAKAEFLTRLNEFLTGYEQAGRALITEYEMNKQLGKDFPGIKVTPLTVDLKDEALLKLFERTNDANMSGQGVHPAMAAIQTQGKLSSGSEIRNAFAMFVAIKTPVKRSLLLKPINYVHRINGWGKGIKWGFRDIEITKLDENPAGKQEVAVAV